MVIGDGCAVVSMDDIRPKPTAWGSLGSAKPGRGYGDPGRLPALFEAPGVSHRTTALVDQKEFPGGPSVAQFVELVRPVRPSVYASPPPRKLIALRSHTRPDPIRRSLLAEQPAFFLASSVRPANLHSHHHHLLLAPPPNLSCWSFLSHFHFTPGPPLTASACCCEIGRFVFLLIVWSPVAIRRGR